MRKVYKLGGAALLIFLAISPSVMAEPVYWEVTGNCYEAILTGGGVSWFEARDLAVQYGGTLVTIGSVEENEFVYDLVKDIPEFWFVDTAGNTEGPYLGGFQPDGSPEPNDGWEWVTGEDWLYTNWEAGEPNNWGVEEDELVFFDLGNSTTSPPYGASTWNDVDGESTEIRGFIIEGPCPIRNQDATWGTVKSIYR